VSGSNIANRNNDRKDMYAPPNVGVYQRRLGTAIDNDDVLDHYSLFATAPAIGPFHYALWNPHRNSPAHASATWRVKEEHAGFTPE
jgi:hypothetical protein